MAVEFANDTTKRAGAEYRDWPENIIIMPELNGRHEHTDIEGLAADIRANGQIQPVGIRKNDQGLPLLIYGHRRWRAITLLNERYPAERRYIKCTYTSATSDAEAFQMAIRENRCRKDVSPIDDCANMRTLENKFSYNHEDIAKVYFPEAVTESELAEALRYVKQRLALKELAPEAAEAVREGRAEITAAVGLAKMTKDQQREVVAKPGKIKVKDVVKSKSQPAPAVQTVEAAPVDSEAFDPALDTPVTIEYEKPVTPIAPPVSGKRKDSKSDGDAYKVRQFVLWLEDILRDLDVADLTNPDVEYVSVKAKKLLGLAHTVDRLTNNGPVNAGTSPAAF
jgi:ParB/RepB/Spo0J family partition protein